MVTQNIKHPVKRIRNTDGETALKRLQEFKYFWGTIKKKTLVVQFKHWESKKIVGYVHDGIEIYIK